MTKFLFGDRIRALREEQGLSQDKLAQLLGFNNRQTISAIETGARQLTAEELVLACRMLNVPLAYLTDPFRLIGEGRFSWRRTSTDAARLEAYEQRAGCWIAAYRTLAAQVGKEMPLMRRALGLTRQARFEDAMRAGERFAAELDLGDSPATRLAEVMERELHILVLMVDADQGISGAACRLPELDCVLISRNEVPGRRHFDLAHELFHILTWDTMPPDHQEDASETSRKRVEQLANNFASAVLMPKNALLQFEDWSSLSHDILIQRLHAAADTFCVTIPALTWRLVSLDVLSRADANALLDKKSNRPKKATFDGSHPALFSRPFMNVIGDAISNGFVSVRRIATLLDMSIDDLENLFAAHGLDAPFDL